MPAAAGAVRRGQPGYDPLRNLAAAFEVDPDLDALVSAILDALPIERSKENWLAVAEVVTILIVQDSRNLNRLGRGRSVPKVQRAVMVQMVLACQPGIDADEFVGMVLARLESVLSR